MSHVPELIFCVILMSHIPELMRQTPGPDHIIEVHSMDHSGGLFEVPQNCHMGFGEQRCQDVLCAVPEIKCSFPRCFKASIMSWKAALKSPELMRQTPKLAHIHETHSMDHFVGKYGFSQYCHMGF